MVHVCSLRVPDVVSSDDNMHDADIANGENPDEASRQPEDAPEVAEEHRGRQRDAGDESVLTGERQAEKNREDEPPA